MRLAQLQQASLPRPELQQAVDNAVARFDEPKEQLRAVTQAMGLPEGRWQGRKVQPTDTPCLVHHAERGWGILRAPNAQGQWNSLWWKAETQQWIEDSLPLGLEAYQAIRIRLARPYSALRSPVLGLIRDEILTQKRPLLEAALGGLMVGVTALLTSFYSMQVYDRVVPTGAMATLWVLTLGVLAFIGFEFAVKHVRSRLMEGLTEAVDQRLARAVYARFLALRLDQIPQSVGALAGQLRGYESVRSFLTGVSGSVLVDAPFAILFLIVIGFVGGALAFIPAFFFVVSLMIGLVYRRRMDALANAAQMAANLKTGLLVETVEGAEVIKSGQGGWRMLGRWMSTTDDARDQELEMRRITEDGQHLTQFFQQVSYTLMVALGAWMITQNRMTMGELIACSILSGRVLSPVAMVSAQLVQWSNAKAALKGLDAIWNLQDDHHGQAHPLVLTDVQGDYRLEQVGLQYRDRAALQVPSLHIRAGERVAVLGPVGAGKTTLLRLLSGMYKPQNGRVLLDGVDISHIAKPGLAEHIGYLPQDGRLFAGTLRENLILGLLDPGDEALLQCAKLSGLMSAVIANHPQGLQQPIFEGGIGLSGGQRQLVNFTRVLLRRPKVWLLDEPTSNLDRNSEMQVLRALSESLSPSSTLVVVTHKTEILPLVGRIIVVADNRVVMDGPRNEVLARLQSGGPSTAAAASSETATAVQASKPQAAHPSESAPLSS